MNWQETYNEWKQFDILESSLAEELETMTQEDIQDAFDSPLSFGTAGMRGILGPGINRMNIYTVRQASEGLALLIDQAGPEAKKQGVAIAYDCRHQSSEFAMEAALVLGKHGIKTYVYESLRPTPVLSFAVRYLQAFAGIMITASHNPAAYNGFKVYGQDGGQMTPEDADQVTDFIKRVESPLLVEVADKTDMLGSGMIEIIGDRVDQAYLEEMKKITMDSELIERMADNVSIVFTPLHGTGREIGMKALDQAGFKQIHLVQDQADADGAFPTVSSPNPESPLAFTLAEELGNKVEADILLATDPDADRLGAMILEKDGSYRLLTGNQIACLMIDYLLQQLNTAERLPENGVIIKSIVSTDLANRIAEDYGIRTIEVLTGFKYIAEKIQEFEDHQDSTFLLGFEESFGYLIKAFARDKDAIQALVLLAELTAYHKEQGRSLANALEDLYLRYGYFLEKTMSIDFPGISGKESMQRIMEQIRQTLPSSFAGIQVDKSLDYLSSQAIKQSGQTCPISLPKADVLKFILEDGSWVAFRPSGTEPKLKVYIGVKAQDQDAAKLKLDTLEKELIDLID